MTPDHAGSSSNCRCRGGSCLFGSKTASGRFAAVAPILGRPQFRPLGNPAPSSAFELIRAVGVGGNRVGIPSGAAGSRDRSRQAKGRVQGAAAWNDEGEARTGDSVGCKGTADCGNRNRSRHQRKDSTSVAGIVLCGESLVNQATDRPTVYIFGEGDTELASIVFLFFGCGWNVRLLDGRKFRGWWTFRRISRGSGNCDGRTTFRTPHCFASEIKSGFQFGLTTRCRSFGCGSYSPPS